MMTPVVTKHASLERAGVARALSRMNAVLGMRNVANLPGFKAYIRRITKIIRSRRHGTWYPLA